MRSYSRFLFRYLKNKKSILVVIAFVVTAMFMVDWLRVGEYSKERLSYVEHLDTFGKFFPFLFASLFTTLMIVYIFKDGESDGSELLIVSKPISRASIVLSKFLMILFALVAYSLIDFVTHIGSASLDHYAGWISKIKYAASLAFGGLVVQIILASILILFSTLISRVGTLVMGIMIGAFIPIFSFILAPATKGQAYGYHFHNNRYIFGADSFEKIIKDTAKSSTGNPEDLYKPEDIAKMTMARGTYTIIGTFVDQDGNLKQEPRSFYEYENERSYDPIAYGDLWYQWGRFLSIFQGNDNHDMNIVQRWEKYQTYFTSDKNDTNGTYVDPKAWYHIQFTTGIRNFIPMTSVKDLIPSREKLMHVIPVIDRVIELGGDKDLIKDFLAKDPAKYGKIDAEKLSVAYGGFATSTNLRDKLNYITNMGDIIMPFSISEKEYTSFLVYMYEQTKMQIHLPAKFVWPTTIVSHGHKGSTPSTFLYEEGPSHVKTLFVGKPFIETNTVIYIWLGIGLGLIALATFVYARRDFK